MKPNTQASIEALVTKLKLPEDYLQTVSTWFLPLCNALNECTLKKHQHQDDSIPVTPLFVGVQGTQGSGKSTLSEFICTILKHEFDLSSVILSIDDFYHTRAKRQQLAKEVHPLLATRGVPGTHDMALMRSTLNGLGITLESSSKEGATQAPTAIPRFDKSIDDRKAESDWDVVPQQVDVVILEGWCVGALAERDTALNTPINTLEAEEDANGSWRNHVNDALETYNRDVFNFLDFLVVLNAPSFECVYEWRGRQEHKLIEATKAKGGNITRTFDEAALKRFIAHYERITRHALATMPNRADWCFYLNGAQKIERQTVKPWDTDFIIVTDLDGTLLDHHSYAWDAAKPALEKAKNKNIPVIINTSKTFDEVIELQKELALNAPFIVENGSALYLPHGFLSNYPNFAETDTHTLKAKNEAEFIELSFGVARENIVEFLKQLKYDFGFTFSSYSDWSVETLMEKTDLPREAAKASMSRRFSEPLIWEDSDSQFVIFSELVKQHGLKILKGGRFVHILGQTDKAKPMRYFKTTFYTALTQTICLGDSPNDLDMLNAADIAVCVKKYSGDYPPATGARVIKTQGIGPIGWNDAINDLI